MADVSEVFVDYAKWCSSCRYFDIDEAEEPCDSCMTNDMNFGTDKPVKYEEKK